jgi:hypothetical protein
MIEAELGRPTSALFASFDLEPLAAASIGQAHAATLLDGAEVIVKVRRQDMVEQIKEYYSARSQPTLRTTEWNLENALASMCAPSASPAAHLLPSVY